MPPPRSRFFPFGLPGYRPPRSRFFPGCGHPRAVRADGRYGHHEQYGPTGTRGTTGTKRHLFVPANKIAGTKRHLFVPSHPKKHFAGTYNTQNVPTVFPMGTNPLPNVTKPLHTKSATKCDQTATYQIRHQMCQTATAAPLLKRHYLAHYFFDLRALFIERLNSRSSNVMMPLSCTSILDLPLTFSLITSSPTNE